MRVSHLACCAYTMASAFRTRADLTDIPSSVSVTSKADYVVQDQQVAAAAPMQQSARRITRAEAFLNAHREAASFQRLSRAKDS